MNFSTFLLPLPPPFTCAIMGTRSTQTIRTDKRVLRCWRHWDGYHEGVGADLLFCLISLLFRFTIEDTKALFDNARIIKRFKPPTGEELEYLQKRSPGKPLAYFLDEYGEGSFSGEKIPLSEQVVDHGIIIVCDSDDFMCSYDIDFVGKMFTEKCGLSLPLNLCSLIIQYTALGKPAILPFCFTFAVQIHFVCWVSWTAQERSCGLVFFPVPRIDGVHL